MRNLKRALSLALASVMLMGMMVVGTSASYADVSSKNNLEAIEVLKAVGVMTGDDKGNFNPDANVTRNEMAVIMCNLLGLKIGGSHPFTDVPAWAAPYVAACYNNGIIAGVSATQFNGDANVTAVQASLMVMKALGYFGYAGEFGDNWKLSVVKQASKINLYNGINAYTDQIMTRNEVAQLVLNALEATMVETDGNGGTTIKGDGFEITTGSTKYTEVKNDKSDDYRTKTEDKDEVQQLVEKLFGTDVEKTDAVDELGRPAHKWTYEDDDVLAAKEAKYVVTLTKSYDDEQKLLDLAKKDIDSVDSVNYVLNGDDSKTFTDFGAGDTLYFYVTDKKVTDVCAARYILGKIDSVDNDVTKADEKDGVSAYVDFTNDFDYSDTDVKDTDIPGFDAKTYVEDAVIAICMGVKDNNDVIVDSYVAKSVKDSVSTVKQTTTQNYLTVDGTKYVEAEGAGVVANVKTGSDNTYKFYLDNNGYVLGYETVNEDAVSIKDTYVIESLWYDSTTGKNGAPEYKYYARLVALDGTVKTVELEAEGNKADGKGDYKLNDSITKDALGLKDTTFVTISDKDVKNTVAIEANEEEGIKAAAIGAVKLSKKNNDKFNLGAWDFEDGKYKIADNSLTGQLDTDDTKNNGIRLNKNTQYVMIATEDDEVTTKVYTGAIKYNFTNKANSNVVLVDADKDTVALYVVVSCKADADNTKLDKVESEDYIFVNNFNTAKAEKNEDYTVVTVYTETGAKESWKVADATGTLNGFYTYSKNDDGYYELEKAAADDDLGNVNDDWDKDNHIGYIEGATSITADALDQNLLTVGNLADINVKNAKFVDLHDTDKDGQYERSINSLSALDKLVNADNAKVESFSISLSIDKDGAIVIFLTSAVATVAP